MPKKARKARKGRRGSGMVIYDTEFGNTEKIANSISAGLKRSGVRVVCLGTSDVELAALKSQDLLVFGAPTQKFTASERMKELIEGLDGLGLRGKRFFAFDTKLPSKFSGSAAKYIESKLISLGMKPAGPNASAIGRGSVFKLDEGEEERFEEIGFELGSDLAGSQ